MNKVLLFLLLLVNICAAMDREDIRLRTRALWGEYISTNSHWPDSVLNPIINDAQAMIAHLGKAVEQDTTIILTMNTRVFDLPYDFDGIVSVYHFTRIDDAPPIVASYMPWEVFSKGLKEDSRPAGQYTIYNDKLYIFPASEDDSQDSLRVNYYATVTEMSDDTMTCRLPDLWHLLVPIIAKDILRIKDTDQNVFDVVLPKIQAYQREHLRKRAEKVVEP